MKETYTQVLLYRDNESRVLWLPTELLHGGPGAKTLTVDGVAGWKIIETYASYPKTHIEKYPTDFKTGVVRK